MSNTPPPPFGTFTPLLPNVSNAVKQKAITLANDFISTLNTHFANPIPFTHPTLIPSTKDSDTIVKLRNWFNSNKFQIKLTYSHEYDKKSGTDLTLNNLSKLKVNPPFINQIKTHAITAEQILTNNLESPLPGKSLSTEIIRKYPWIIVEGATQAGKTYVLELNSYTIELSNTIMATIIDRLMLKAITECNLTNDNVVTADIMGDFLRPFFEIAHGPKDLGVKTNRKEKRDIITWLYSDIIVSIEIHSSNTEIRQIFEPLTYSLSEIRTIHRNLLSNKMDHNKRLETLLVKLNNNMAFGNRLKHRQLINLKSNFIGTNDSLNFTPLAYIRFSDQKIGYIYQVLKEYVNETDDFCFCVSIDEVHTRIEGTMKPAEHFSMIELFKDESFGFIFGVTGTALLLKAAPSAIKIIELVMPDYPYTGLPFNSNGNLLNDLDTKYWIVPEFYSFKTFSSRFKTISKTDSLHFLPLVDYNLMGNPTNFSQFISEIINKPHDNGSATKSGNLKAEFRTPNFIVENAINSGLISSTGVPVPISHQELNPNNPELQKLKKYYDGKGITDLIYSFDFVNYRGNSAEFASSGITDPSQHAIYLNKCLDSISDLIYASLIEFPLHSSVLDREGKGMTIRFSDLQDFSDNLYIKHITKRLNTKYGFNPTIVIFNESNKESFIDYLVNNGYADYNSNNVIQLKSHLVVLITGKLRMNAEVPPDFKTVVNFSNISSSSIEHDSMLQGDIGRVSGYGKNTPRILLASNSYNYILGFAKSKGHLDVFNPRSKNLLDQTLNYEHFKLEFREILEDLESKKYISSYTLINHFISDFEFKAKTYFKSRSIREEFYLNDCDLKNNYLLYRIMDDANIFNSIKTLVSKHLESSSDPYHCLGLNEEVTKYIANTPFIFKWNTHKDEKGENYITISSRKMNNPNFDPDLFTLKSGYSQVEWANCDRNSRSDLSKLPPDRIILIEPVITVMPCRDKDGDFLTPVWITLRSNISLNSNDNPIGNLEAKDDLIAKSYTNVALVEPDIERQKKINDTKDSEAAIRERFK